MTTDTGVTHHRGVWNSNGRTIAVIQFVKAGADQQLRSHGAQLENQYGHRSHQGLRLLSFISGTFTGQAVVGTVLRASLFRLVTCFPPGISKLQWAPWLLLVRLMIECAAYSSVMYITGRLYMPWKSRYSSVEGSESCRSVLLWGYVLCVCRDLRVPTGTLQTPADSSHKFVHPQLTPQLTMLGRHCLMCLLKNSFRKKGKPFFQCWKCVFYIGCFPKSSRDLEISGYAITGFRYTSPNYSSESCH